MTDEPVVRWMRAIMAHRPPAPDLDRAVEPKLASSGPQGNPDGPGRGSLTQRQRARLEALRGFWQHDRRDTHEGQS